jgi:hypothetical protein
VNVVPALRQLQTQFCGYYPAATVSGIAGDPNLHSAFSKDLSIRWP